METKLLEIDELGTGDCFGDDSLLSHSPIQHSVITVIPTEIYVLDNHDFMNLGPAVVESFKNFHKEYPCD